jgi:hypothetical protein
VNPAELLIVELDPSDARIIATVAGWIGVSPDLVARGLLTLHLRRLRADARGQVAHVAPDARPGVVDVAGVNVAAMRLRELLAQAAALDRMEGGTDA